jgi:hypothetical protein
MQLTDQELFYILQVKSPDKQMPWEKTASIPLGRNWAEWAKSEVLSGKDVGSGCGINLERCSIYLARLLRVLETVVKDGGFEKRLREDGTFVYAESTIKTILSDGLEACGCPAFNHQDAISLAIHNELLAEYEYDDWRPGMESGTGWRTYYGLTFKGNRQAERAGIMSTACDKASEAMPKTCEPEMVKPVYTESPKSQPPESDKDIPPSTSEKPPEMPEEDWGNAGRIVLLLLAQTYYKLLESAVRNSCAATDMDLNGWYLWTVKNLQHLLNDYPDLDDFPGVFEPCFENLMQSSIIDVDWADMVAPDAERFLSSVQEYVMTKGTTQPKEFSAAWILVETFKSSVNEAIQAGEAYTKRMAQEFQKMTGSQKQKGAKKSEELKSSETPNSPDVMKEETPKAAVPSAKAQSAQQTPQATGEHGQGQPIKIRSPFCGDTDYTAVPLTDIIVHLRDWKDASTRCIQVLKKNQSILAHLKNDVPQDFYDTQFSNDMEKWRRDTDGLTKIPPHLEMSRPFLPKYSDVEKFIEVFIAEFERYSKEFGQLIEELPRAVRQSHAESLRQIVMRCDGLDSRCRRFREDYMNSPPWNDLAAEVYEEVRNMMADYRDLSNVAFRLDALVGTSRDNALSQINPEDKNSQENSQQLAMDTVWEPRTMLWNGKPFRIEKPASCYNAYNPDNLEDDDPKGGYDPSCPWNKPPTADEIEHLRELMYIGYDQTISIFIMLTKPDVIYPDQLFHGYDKTHNSHAGGSIIVDGVLHSLKWVRVQSTDPKIRAQIEAERMAQAAMSAINSSIDPTQLKPTSSEGIRQCAIREVKQQEVSPRVNPLANQELKADFNTLNQKTELDIPLACQQEQTESAVNKETSDTMSAEAVRRLCRLKPNEAFFYWKSIENAMSASGAHQTENEVTPHPHLQIVKDWFERYGHWRELKLDASKVSHDGVVCPDGLRLISEFVKTRQAKIQYVNYDKVHADHVRKFSDNEKEYTEYAWTYFLSGEPQIILRVDDPDLRISTEEAHYLSKANPYAFAYWVDCDEMGIREVNVFFLSGKCLGFMCGHDGSIYPEHRFIEGDYELRNVVKSVPDFDTLHTDVRAIKQSTNSLPEDLTNIKVGINTINQHVRGVPIMQAELAEAIKNPEALALEIQNKIAAILTPDDQVIWRAVRNAGGSQKDALPLLRQSKLVNSAATLSRRVKEINKILAANGLSSCSAAGPSVRFNKSGGNLNDEGKTALEELTPTDRDWAENPDSRDCTIRLYLAATKEDKTVFHQTYYGIEDEAQEYKKRCGMKSG